MGEWERVKIGEFEIEPTDRILAAFSLDDQEAVNLFGVVIERAGSVHAVYRLKYPDGVKNWFSFSKHEGTEWADMFPKFVEVGFDAGRIVLGIEDRDDLMEVIESFPHTIIESDVESDVSMN